MAATPCLKLWIDSESGLVMSDYRARLMSEIARTGSLAQAAVAMGLSDRRAWGKINEMEQHLGFPVVESAVGGAGGGNTMLTPRGAELLAAFHRFQERSVRAMEAIFAEEFPGPIAGHPDG